MDAFHRVIFFDGGLGDILPNLAVLTGYSLVFTVLAIKFFRIKN